MRVQCPGCNKTLNAPDSLAGRVIKCPGCGVQMQMPAAEVPAEPPVFDDAVGEPSAPDSAPPPPPPSPSPAPAPTRSPSKRAAAPAGTKPCQFCGEQIQPSAVKCRHCGELLSAPRRRAQMAGGQLVAGYRAGMRGLAVALILLGLLAVLKGVVGVVALRQLWGAISPENHSTMPIAMGIMCGVLGVGAMYFLLGFFAWRMHNWVNWLVAVFSGLGVALSVLGIALGGVDVVTAVGFVAQMAFLVTSVMNLRKRSRLRAAGVDPRAAGVQPKGAGRARVPARTAGAKGRPRGRR